MMGLDVIRRLEGEEAFEAYGICDCVNSTSITQVWTVYRAPILKPDGELRFNGYVICGLCGEGPP